MLNSRIGKRRQTRPSNDHRVMLKCRSSGSGLAAELICRASFYLSNFSGMKFLILSRSATKTTQYPGWKGKILSRETTVGI